jgi:hypothetical protein
MAGKIPPPPPPPRPKGHPKYKKPPAPLGPRDYSVDCGAIVSDAVVKCREAGRPFRACQLESSNLSRDEMIKRAQQGKADPQILEELAKDRFPDKSTPGALFYCRDRLYLPQRGGRTREVPGVSMRESDIVRFGYPSLESVSRREETKKICKECLRLKPCGKDVSRVKACQECGWSQRDDNYCRCGRPCDLWDEVNKKAKDVFYLETLLDEQDRPLFEEQLDNLEQLLEDREREIRLTSPPLRIRKPLYTTRDLEDILEDLRSLEKEMRKKKSWWRF